jgi:hypothetical protein
MVKKGTHIEQLKINLSKKLADDGYLWSYKKEDGNILSDDELIEKSLVHLEFEDMYLLFDIFPYKKVKQIWIDKLIVQNEYYNILNKLLAVFFFNIKKPENYISNVGRRIKKRHA